MLSNKVSKRVYAQFLIVLCMVGLASYAIISAHNDRVFFIPSNKKATPKQSGRAKIKYAVAREPITVKEARYGKRHMRGGSRQLTDYSDDGQTVSRFMEFVDFDEVSSEGREASEVKGEVSDVVFERLLVGADPTSMPTHMPSYNGTNSTNSTDDHADDHGDDHGGGHQFSLFGGMSELETNSATISFIIIIVCVLFLEHFFHELHASTHDTPFSDMVSAIEKELMIVGSMAFAFKCIVFTTDFLPLDWFHGLEFADVLVPITSFMFCSQGFALIIMSIRETETWRRSYHLHLFEILDEYYLQYYADDANDKVAAASAKEAGTTAAPAPTGVMRYLSRISFYEYGEEDYNKLMAYKVEHDGQLPDELPPRHFSVLAGLQSIYLEVTTAMQYVCHHTPLLQQFTRWVPFFTPTIYGEIEFRILHAAFCEQFEIQQNALHYDEYVRRILEKYILQIITIDPGQWVMIIVLGVLNWIRSSNEVTFSDECKVPAGHDDHSTDDAVLVCTARADIETFFELGLLMLFMNFTVAAFARYYEFKVLAMMKVHSVKDYAPFLQTTESAKVHKKKEHQRLSTEELRIAMSAAKERVMLKHGSGHKHGKNCPNPFAPLIWLFNKLFGKHKSVHENDGITRGPDGGGAGVVKTVFGSSGTGRRGFSASMRGVPTGGGNNSRPSTGASGGRKRTESGSGANRHAAASTDGGAFNITSPLSPTKVHPLPFTDPAASAPASEHASGASTPERGGQRYTLKDIAADKEAAKKRELMTHVSESEEDGFVRSVTDMLQKALSKSKDNSEAAKGAEASRDEAGGPVRKRGNVLPVARATDRMTREMRGVFFLDKSGLFFDAVDHMMMIISFYYALWLVNYSTVAKVLPNAAEWQLLTLAPAIASTAVYLMAVRSAALLKATTSLDADVLELTLEDAETSKMLGQAVRHKILKRLQSNLKDHGDEHDDKDQHDDHHEHHDHHHDHPGHEHGHHAKHHQRKEAAMKHMDEIEEELKRLFSSIDTDNSMLLSRAEFKEFLGELHISFSNKRWRQIFREMDRNYDDQISFDELFLFLFPDHNEALSREMKRLKLVGDRVKRYSEFDANSRAARSMQGGVPQILTNTPSQRPVLVASGSAMNLTPTGRDGKVNADGDSDRLFVRPPVGPRSAPKPSEMMQIDSDVQDFSDAGGSPRSNSNK